MVPNIYEKTAYSAQGGRGGDAGAQWRAQPAAPDVAAPPTGGEPERGRPAWSLRSAALQPAASLCSDLRCQQGGAQQTHGTTLIIEQPFQMPFSWNN